MVELFVNSADPDSAASDLDLHCLPTTLLGVSRPQWVKQVSVGEPKKCSHKTYMLA